MFGSFLNKAKGQAMSMAGRKLLGSYLEKYGEMLNFSVQPETKTIILEMLLKGEQDPIKITLDGYELLEASESRRQTGLARGARHRFARVAAGVARTIPRRKTHRIAAASRAVAQAADLIVHALPSPFFMRTPFIHQDFLLDTAPARELYHRYAARPADHRLSLPPLPGGNRGDQDMGQHYPDMALRRPLQMARDAGRRGQ